MDWWIVVMTLGYLAFMGWILWIVVYYKIKKSQQRSEERLRLLERVGTSQELAEFLESAAGDRLLATFSPKPSDPRSMILGGFSTGLILLFLGFGFLVLTALGTFGDGEIFQIPGVLLCFAGTAVLISVGVSRRLLKQDRDTAT